MKIILALVLTCIVSSSAFAQQQSAGTVALQINAAVANMALELDQARQTLQTLQSDLAKAQARIKELEPKTEPQK